MSQKQHTDVNVILSALQDANLGANHDIWVPSLNRTVKFADITTGQQKEMLRAVVDNPVYQSSFISALYKILTSNCRDDQVNVGSLLLSDKIAITLQLRLKSIGNLIKFTIDDVPHTVDLSAINFQKQFEYDPSHIEPRQFIHSNIHITCRPPTIHREYRLVHEMRDRMDKAEVTSYNDVRNIIADAYIGEIAKYMDVIQLGGDSNKIGMSLTDIGFGILFNMVERIPSALTQDIVKYIEEIQARNTACLKVLDIEGRLVDLPFDATLFATK